ncbi:hypothetical protein [Polyangium jinanense]|uniref:Uncharacterized protein n=1 Tax=Polyangium jinanense TaxID=2829994 RepID=A0A9X4AXR0_9BACT|nr:hypothetical protein [Polyangium jinanense]MDC3962183.1 hypothetical protein [Polyangium jinanense]MDC3988868.1 hypothetical protein [Polyangium jinanense]
MSGEDEGNGKKLGPIAAVIAAIGMFMARAGDDCARIGAKGAMLSDDAARGLGRAGSLADDGMRGGGKLGSLADDGMRAGAKSPLPGIHAPTEGGGGLVEEAMSAGAKAEGHAGDLAELGVDVSLEILSNVGPSDGDDDDHEGEAPVTDGVHIPPPPSATSKKGNPADLLRARNIVSSPMLLTLASGTTKTAATETDPYAWLESHDAHNPVGLLYASRGKLDTKTTISLVSPSGATTDDATIHRTCLGLAMNCVVLVCEPDAAGAKESCVKDAATAWKSVEATNLGGKPALRDFLGKLLLARAGRPSLRNLVVSRLDVDSTPPRIVRSRVDTKTTPTKP